MQRFGGPQEMPATLENAAAKLRPILTEAVAGHLIADVPLGIFLSSGLDSTAIVALASAAQSGLHTFTVIFSEQEFSEAEPARATAKHFGTRHEELLLDGAEMLAHLDDAVDALDQPSMDGINTYFVSWAVRRAGIEGGAFRTWWRRNFRRLFDVCVGAAGSSHGGNWEEISAWLVPRNRLGCGARRRRARRRRKKSWQRCGVIRMRCRIHTILRGRFSRPIIWRRCAELAHLSGNDLPWRNWMKETAREASALDSFNAISCLEARSYMVNTLLRDTDSVSMAHSLEVRVPLLDHVLVEFVSRLPTAVK